GDAYVNGAEDRRKTAQGAGFSNFQGRPEAKPITQQIEADDVGGVNSKDRKTGQQGLKNWDRAKSGAGWYLFQSHFLGKRPAIDRLQRPDKTHGYYKSIDGTKQH